MRQKAAWYAAAALAPIGAACLGSGQARFLGALCWAAALALIVYAIFDRLGETRAWAKWCARVLIVLYGAGFVFFLVLEGLVISGAHSDEAPDGVACVIVLGGGVKNGEPQPMLCARLDAALAFLDGQSEAMPVIVSGALDPGETLSEAEIMARYLAARGVDESRVWKEDRATSTRTNFLYSYELMAARGIDCSRPFAFVTSDYHVYRSRYLAAAPQACAVAAKPPADFAGAIHEFSGFVREAFALANEILQIGADLDI